MIRRHLNSFRDFLRLLFSDHGRTSRFYPGPVDVGAQMIAAAQQHAREYPGPPQAALQRLADLARGPAPQVVMDPERLKRELKPEPQWTPRHVDPEVWAALHGRKPRAPAPQGPRRTLTRADALKRNLKRKT